MASSKHPDRSRDVAEIVALAEGCLQMRDWETAESLFRKAVDLDESPMSRITFGVHLAERQQYFEAISLFMPLLDGNNRSAIAIVCHNLAAIYRDVGDLDLAQRFQWRATLMQDDLGSEDLLGMANDALVNGRVEVAESLVLAACSFSDDAPLPTEDPDLLATLGLVKAAADSKREGLLTIFAAYRQHHAAGEYRKMGIDLLNMSAIFGDLQRHRPERSCLIRAARCLEQADAYFLSQKVRDQLEMIDQMQNVRSFDSRRN